MAERFDAIVIGGGHNGLVCAAYLARAGQSVLLLEAASQVGGTAVTAEIAPGYRVSACAHFVHLLHPQVIAELALARHGLTYSARDIPSLCLAEDGRHLRLSSDPEATARELAAFSQADAEAFPPFHARLLRFAGALQPFLGSTPPRLGSKARADQLALLKLGWAVRRLGREDMREFLRIVTMNIADLLEEEFETDLLMGAMAWDAVLGTHMGPRSPGSVLTLLYRLTGQVEGVRGALAHPRGGLGALTEAMARAAEAAGTTIRKDAAVKQILVESDRAAGVELVSGERIAAGTVISNADPHTTFLDLLGARHLDAGFARRVTQIRMRGTTAKLNLALDGLPSFRGLDENDLAARLLIAPGIDPLERAFNHAKYGEYSQEPAIEIAIPSLHDESLAPHGKHVLSAVVQYAPYNLKGGWDAAREDFADRLVQRIARFAPDLKDRIVARQLITPLDLERDYRLTGGHWHHGELTLDQLLMLRPVPGSAGYATPLPGLYLCGAGAHPGGGVMGAAGMNAARRVIAKEAA